MKLVDYFKELQKKYAKLGVVTKVVIAFVVLLVMAAFILVLLPTMPATQKGNVSDFYAQYQKRYEELNERIRKALYPKVEVEEEPKLTLQSLMCWVLWETNQTNMTIANTTCFKNSVLGYDCLCVTSLS